MLWCLALKKKPQDKKGLKEFLNQELYSLANLRRVDTGERASGDWRTKTSARRLGDTVL
jgi:hypothetical protein